MNYSRKAARIAVVTYGNRVYAAEHHLPRRFWKPATLPRDLRRLFNTCFELEGAPDLPELKFTHGDGSGRAFYDGSRVYLSRNAAPFVAIHEAAHIWAAANPGHGQVFVDNYLMLAEAWNTQFHQALARRLEWQGFNVEGQS